MDSKSVPQGNDLTERRGRRRLSSILKVTRSPLRDLGIGNELHQESTIDKRRKSFRRVSFAETIRVFTPELQAAGSGDADNGGVGTDSSFDNESESTDSKCPITGMDRLLHGPLQAPSHQAEWNFTNCNKDQTIFFSSNNDMDMTASNTVAIHGLVEEKPKKIDTSLFLASLKHPTNDESSNFDFKILSADEKLLDFQPPTTSSSQTKIKFADFLASMKNESISSKIGVEKENIFQFVSKENMFSTKTTLPFFDAVENTGNLTCVFRDQEDGLDLTRCHTTNITSFVPTVNHKLANLGSNNPLTSYSSTHNKQELGRLEQVSVKPPTSVPTDQTMLCEDDMDMTFSHTARIRGVLKEDAPPAKTKTSVTCSNEKTIIFNDENEMELTNDSVFFNSTFNKGRQSIQRNRNAFSADQTVCPEEDMDMTRSHTVAIDGPTICGKFFSKEVTGDTVHSEKRQRSFGLLLPFQMTSSSENLEEQKDIAATKLNLLPLKSVSDIGKNNETVKFQNSCSISTANAQFPSAEKTVLFSCEQDDMEMTKSHTIAIDSSASGVVRNACFSNPNLNDKRSHLIGLRLSSGFNKTVFFSGDSDDMDLTQSHTAHITQKALVRNNLSNDTQNRLLNTTDQTKHLQENMEMTVIEHDGLQIRSSLAAADDKTVVFTCRQQDMDITQSHTVAIDGDVWCKGFPFDTCTGDNKELNCVSIEERDVALGSKMDSRKIAMPAASDDKMTSLSNPNLCLPGSYTNPADVSSGKFSSDQDTMELTKSHTIAIDHKILTGSDSTQRLNSILKDKKTNGRLELSTTHNKTVFFSIDGDDMELTQSHTTCIDQNKLTSAKKECISNAVDHTRHVLDDMEMTMVEKDGVQRGPILNEANNNKTVVFTSDQQDMDITRSHTVAIDGDTLSKGFISDTSLAINKRADFISSVPRCLPDKNVVLESKKVCGSVGKMYSVKEDTLVPLSKPEFISGRCVNIIDVPCLKSTGPLQSMLKGNSVSLPNQDDIDKIRARTVTVERILPPGESTNIEAITHAPYPDKTVVFEDDMEYTRSHTAVIDGINANELPSQSIALKSMAFSADDMDITKSNTVFIDNLETNEMAKDYQQPKYKKAFIKLSGQSDQILDNLTMTTIHTKPPITEKVKDVEKLAGTSLLSNNKTFLSLDEEDMDLTKANTIAIENKIFGEVEKLQASNLSKTQNRFASSFAPLCKTILKDHQIPHYASTTDFKEADMDITKSNTVFINHIPGEKTSPRSMMESKEVLSSQKPPDGTKVAADQIELNNINGGELHNNARAQINQNVCSLSEASKNRPLLLSCPTDAHTVTSKKNMSGDGRKSQSSGLSLTLNSGVKENFAVSNKLMDASDCKIKHAVLTDDELPNELCFVKNLTCRGVEIDLSSTNNIFIGTSKRKSIPSQQKSFSIFDETVHQVCNMEETTANLDLVTSNNANHPSKRLFEQTVCNQSEMEITKCHTTAIESKMGTIPSKHPAESVTPVHKAGSLFTEDMSAKSTVNAEVLKNAQDISSRDNGSHQKPLDYCVLPCEQETMEISSAQTTVEDHCCENLNASNPARSGIIVGKFADMSDILSGTSQEIENSSKQPMDPTGKKESKRNDFNISLSSKTVMFSEDLGEMELTRIDTMAIHGLSEPMKKTASAGIEKTCLFLGSEMDLTQSNTVFIDQELKEVDTFSNVVKTPNSPVSLISDNCEGTVAGHKEAHTEEDAAFDDKFIILHGNELTDHKPPSVGKEIIPLDVQAACNHTPTNSISPFSDLCEPEPRDSCASKEQKTIDETISSKHSEAYGPQKDPEAIQDPQIIKKHRLSKRVSFCVPEKDNTLRGFVVEPNTEITLQNRIKMFIDPNVQSDGSQFKPGSKNEQTEDNSGIVKNIVLISDKPVNEEVANHAQETVSSIELSQKDKNRRRSIADIQLRIRSLSEKSKNRPSNHTAPVSCPTNELSTQISNPISGDCVPEQKLVEERVSIKDVQANDDEPKGKGTTKEMCLQNRLSFNMLQPKLPSKRHSNTSNLQDLVPFAISKASTQNSRTSMSHLKAFADGDGQCIEEEMLPACPDDNDGNSLFQYEVPEGAWEELCEKEALHENPNDCSLSKETANSHKRARDPEYDAQFHREKKIRRNDDTHNTKTSVGFKSPHECSRSDYSSHHTSKTMEQTYYSSSSQDSRGEGISVELSSQQYSQMDSQLPWDNGCGQNLWQKFQDGTITIKEFFMLLRIRILIQKPRCSELPVNRGNYETLSSTDFMLDLFIYQPKLQVYEEECHNLYQIIEELKLYTDMQEKPLKEISSLLWEAMSMCSEDELMCFGLTLKNMKSMYSKKSKILAHEAKVSVYSKLLHKAQVQVDDIQTRLMETDKLLEEMDDCISSLQSETAKLEEGFKINWTNIPGGKEMQCELENLSSQEQIVIRERLNLENQKETVLTQLGCLQDKARGLDKCLQDPCLAEWDMVEWTDTKATFVFLYDSLELTIMFGDEIDGEKFNNQLCRRISKIILMSQLNEEAAASSSLLVHRLILQFIEKKGYLHETNRMQRDIPKLLLDVSLVVSRCKLLGEEVEHLMKWGAKYNIVKAQVESNEVKLLFSSSAAFAKFELCVHISEMYPTEPLSFTVLNRIGNTDYSRIAAVIAKVPVGLWQLKRTVRSIHEHLLV
ncbi:outer kinetochore KNL1 complex subunit KNL1 [Mantella aurantiaca]